MVTARTYTPTSGTWYEKNASIGFPPNDASDGSDEPLPVDAAARVGYGELTRHRPRVPVIRGRAERLVHDGTFLIREEQVAIDEVDLVLAVATAGGEAVRAVPCGAVEREDEAERVTAIDRARELARLRARRERPVDEDAVRVEPTGLR
jgi:hypothetical protein